MASIKLRDLVLNSAEDPADMVAVMRFEATDLDAGRRRYDLARRRADGR